LVFMFFNFVFNGIIEKNTSKSYDFPKKHQNDTKN